MCDACTMICLKFQILHLFLRVVESIVRSFRFISFRIFFFSFCARSLFSSLRFSVDLVRPNRLRIKLARRNSTESNVGEYVI